jgi:hypothetical protein
MSQNDKSPAKQTTTVTETTVSVVATPEPAKTPVPEFGGRKGLEATRYGDWEMNGKCVDF